MNVDNMNFLIATLEAEVLPDGKALSFNMGTWITIESCGTIACIAGTAAILGGKKDWRGWGTRKFAADWLDIGYDQSYDLFICTGKLDYREVTRDVAVKCLKRFRDTGEIAWKL